MFEPAVSDGAQQLRLEEEVAESRGVYADVSLLGIWRVSRGFLRGGLLLLVVDELFFRVRHGGKREGSVCV